MEKSQVEQKIQQLIELEKKINDSNLPNDLSEDFIEKLNNVLLSISKDIENEMAKKVGAKQYEEQGPTIKIERLSKDAKTPVLYSNGALKLFNAGIIEDTDDRKTYTTNIIIHIPEGYIGLVIPHLNKPIFSHANNINGFMNIRNDAHITSDVIIIKPSDNLFPIIISHKKFDYPNKTDWYSNYELNQHIGDLIIIPVPKIKIEEIENF